MFAEALTKLESEGASSWLEPCETFLKEAHRAEEVAVSEKLEDQKEFLKKIGWNFHLGSRRLQFAYENPWGLLLGGESLSFNFGGLVALNGGRSEKDFTPSAAPAAAIFTKSPTIEEMRCKWNKVGTFFQGL